jgi:hypothetical protein
MTELIGLTLRGFSGGMIRNLYVGKARFNRGEKAVLVLQK